MTALRVALLEAFNPARVDRVFMPMGIAYLASFIEREAGVQARVCRTLDEAMAFEPDLVGISSVTPGFPFATTLAETVRAERDIPVVLGGPHITGLPLSLPTPFAAGVLGEGEETFHDIVRAVMRDGRLTGEALADMRGVVFHDGTNRRVTGARPAVRPLDRIPFPKRDWSGIVPNTLWSFSSRGCPYRCRFCSTAEFWESYRVHSARYVVDELNHIIDTFDCHFHTLMDDLFAVNQKRLAEIVALARTELKRPLKLTATIRADLVTDAMCALLRDIGVRYVHLGLESASDRVLSYLKKESTTAAVNQAALDVLAHHGIHAIGSFIIGAPNEDDEDIALTYDFIDRNLRDNKLMSFTFGPLVPFPGTAVWAWAKEKGLVHDVGMDWAALDIDLRYFDAARYLLLNEKMTRERFTEWFHRFNALWASACATIGQRTAAYDRRAGELLMEGSA